VLPDRRTRLTGEVPVVQIIRPLEERLRTNVYSIDEFRMIAGKIIEIESLVEPQWKLVLNNLFISQADILVNGAPN
jgi:hypothetical protein